MNIDEILKLYPGPNFINRLGDYELFIINKYLSKYDYTAFNCNKIDIEYFEHYENNDTIKYYSFTFDETTANNFFEEYNGVYAYIDPYKKEVVYEYERSKLVMYGNKFLLLEHI